MADAAAGRGRGGRPVGRRGRDPPPGLPPLPYVARLAAPGDVPSPGAAVTSVGVDGGARVVSRTTRVREVAWFAMGDTPRRDTGGDDRPFLITERASGRAVGGLFLDGGRLAGVCVGRIEPAKAKGRPRRACRPRWGPSSPRPRASAACSATTTSIPSSPAPSPRGRRPGSSPPAAAVLRVPARPVRRRKRDVLTRPTATTPRRNTPRPSRVVRGRRSGRRRSRRGGETAGRWCRRTRGAPKVWPLLTTT